MDGMSKVFFRSFTVAAFWLVLAAPIHAQTADPFLEAKKAVVWVACGRSQGSGTVINGTEGYVLTSGHVAMNVDEGTNEDECEVSFPDAVGRPTYSYRANVIRATFDERRNRDFAILRIGSPVSQTTLSRPFPFLKTNEFTAKDDAVHVLGYPGVVDRLLVRSGTIYDYVSGFIQTDAEVMAGDSGGAALDDDGRLVGIPTRIVTITGSDGHESTYYELVDIRAVMNWLDTFGPNEHDLFFTHTDAERYHRTAIFIAQEHLGCSTLGRAPDVTSVYCLMLDGTRLSFPNEATFFSWFPDFSNIRFYTLNFIASHQLVRNATFKPGTLVKSATSPSVYVVVDVFGTLRWIPSEERAIELWGPAWAGLVRDIPDEFWTNYTVGQPLDDVI